MEIGESKEDVKTEQQIKATEFAPLEPCPINFLAFPKDLDLTLAQFFPPFEIKRAATDQTIQSTDSFLSCKLPLKRQPSERIVAFLEASQSAFSVFSKT